MPEVTPVRAVHFQELRTRIDALRVRAGLPAFAWTDRVLTPGVTPVGRVHVTELRTALRAAYAAAGRPVPRYTDARVTPGTTPIRASHITELRAAVVELEALRANRPPQAAGSIPAQTLAADAGRVDVAPYFNDPDGDPLTFTAASSRVDVVTVGVAGSIVTLTPVDNGTATVTVTARDAAGLSATQRIAVTVQQRSGGSCTNDLGTVSGTVTRRGSWDGSCPSVHYSNGEYARYYTFTVGGRASVTIDLTSSSVDTWLALRNGTGTGTGLIEADNDGGTGTDARISRTLTAGTYTIEATTLQGGVTGPFMLTLTVEAAGGGTDALEIELTRCEGVARVGSFIRVQMEGTVRARRAVTNVVVNGWVGDHAMAFPDFLGSIAAGESKDFSLSDLVDSDRITSSTRCRVEVTGRTVSGNAAAETTAVSETGPIR